MNCRLSAFCFFTLIVTGHFVSCRLESRSSSATNASVTIDCGSTGRDVPPLLFGSNIQWEHGGDGLLIRDGDSVRWQQQLIAAVDSLHVSCLRFPGGMLANSYHWSGCIGKRSLRSTGLTYAGKKEESDFGTDEFIALCSRLGAQGIITVNRNDGPAEAARWVSYVNKETHGCSPNGAVRSKVRYWEIGNELYSPDARGYCDAEEYGRTIKAFASAMKKVDPSIKIGAALESSLLQAAWMPKVLPLLPDWNAKVLKTAGEDIDFVVVHYYAPFDRYNNNMKNAELLGAGAVVFEENIRRIVDCINSYCKHPVTIAVTEYGAFFGEKILLSKTISSHESALFCASLLCAMMRNGSITVGCNWSLVNNSEFGMIAGDGNAVIKRPLYAVFKNFAAMTGGRVLAMSITSPTYSVKAKGNVPEKTAIPCIDGIAVTLADGNMRAVIINRSPSQQLAVLVHLAEGSYHVMTYRKPPDGKDAWSEAFNEQSNTGAIVVAASPLSLNVIEPCLCNKECGKRKARHF